MINYSAALKAVGGARTGVAPINLLDIQDVNGNFYHFSDRWTTVAPANVATPPPYLDNPVPLSAGQFVAWSRPTTANIGIGSPGSAFANVAGGSVSVTYGHAFEDMNWATWGGFQVPTLPAGAVVQAVYITAYITANDSGLSQWTAPGATDNLETPSVPWDGQASWQIWPSGSASWEDAVTTRVAGVALWATTGGAMFKFLKLLSPSIAVYYSLPGGSGGSGLSSSGVADTGAYKPWLLSVPEFTFHRSSITDAGSFVVQNLSGDTLSRDMEKILRSSALEGSIFVYRNYQPDAAAAWIEVHGKLTIPDGGIAVDTLTLKSSALISPAEDDTPSFQYCETCQWRWGSAQCGATGATECQYSYQTCQVPERIFVVLNNFEKNYGESTANIATQVINRRRRI